MAVFVHGCLLIIESLLLIFVFWKINSRAVVCDPAHQVVGVEIAEPSRLSCICSSTDSIFPQRCAQCLFCQTGRIIWDRNPPPRQVGPQLLRFIPGQKARDLRNWLTVYSYWNQSGPENVASMFLHLAKEYLLDTARQPAPVVETPALGVSGEAPKPGG